MPAFLIDPKTGERVGSAPSAVQIDPATGERVQAAPQLPPVPGISAPQGLTGPPSTNYAGMALKAGNFVKDFDTGVLKGAGSTANNLGHIFYPDFVAKHFTGAPTPQQQDGYFAPANTSQAVGKGVEQVAEFLVPGGAEEAGAAKLASAIPKLGRAAAPVARLATGALSTGLVNKAQGGSFVGGAAAGAAGGALSEGFRAAAPLIAESANAIRATDRAYGKGRGAIGRTILNETTGVNPGSIAKQAGDKIDLYNGQLESLAQQPGAGNVSLIPARGVAQGAEATAALRNNPETIKRTGQISDQLTFPGGRPPTPQLPAPKVIPGFGSAAASPPPIASPLIPPQIPAYQGLQMKRGIGDLKGSWNPSTQNDLADATIGSVYHALDSELDSAIPGSEGLNQKISLLSPVKQRAASTDLNAGVMQRALGRLTRPTGALIPAAAGAGYGYKEGGLPGAATGFVGGYLLPEMIGSPTSQMTMARIANTGLSPTVRALTGGGLQATRKNLYAVPKTP
jgi:hypothetical protein